MRLAEFYQSADVERALTRYRETVPSTWHAAGRLELYRSAHLAFGENASRGERLSEFCAIYEALRRHWQVFRGAAGWPAEKGFGVLTTECQPCGRQSGLTLRTLVPEAHTGVIRACLDCLGPIKPTKSYPTVYPAMAALKFLHFFNPGLFPLYDTAYVWNRVMHGAFRQDYTSFCERRGFHWNQWSVQLCVQYVLWASEVMQSADAECMPRFARWLTSQAPDPSALEPPLQEIEHYYAAAFEVVAIGAAHLPAA